MNIQEILDLINKMEISDRKKIKSGIKIPVVKKEKIVDNYNKEVGALFSLIKENKFRPVISNVKVTENYIVGTDLDCTLFIPNKHNIKSGIYNKLMMETKSYNDIMSDMFEDFPSIEITDEGNNLSYKSKELLDILEKISFSASKDKENLSVNGIRFEKDKVCASDTFRLITKPLISNIETGFTIPIDSINILIRLLKFSNCENIEFIVDKYKLKIQVGDYILQTRLIDLSYPPVEQILEDIKNSDYKNILKIEDDNLKIIFENLSKVGAKSEYSKNSCILDFKNNKIKAIGINTKYEKDIDFIGNIKIDKICLNAKFILDYINTHKLAKLKLEIKDNTSAVVINDEYIIMPLAM